MKKIYIVMESCGQYEDRFESPVKAFTDKNKAEAFVEEKQKYYDELDEKYSAIDIDIQEKMTQLFNRYLKDTDKEMYDAYLKAIDLDVEAKNFNWDEYYEKESDFHDNSELVNKYMDICKLTDDERNAIAVYKEYEDNNYDGLPYFYVSHKELELED